MIRKFLENEAVKRKIKSFGKKIICIGFILYFAPYAIVWGCSRIEYYRFPKPPVKDDGRFHEGMLLDIPIWSLLAGCTSWIIFICHHDCFRFYIKYGDERQRYDCAMRVHEILTSPGTVVFIEKLIVAEKDERTKGVLIKSLGEYKNDIVIPFLTDCVRGVYGRDYWSDGIDALSEIHSPKAIAALYFLYEKSNDINIKDYIIGRGLFSEPYMENIVVSNEDAKLRARAYVGIFLKNDFVRLSYHFYHEWAKAGKLEEYYKSLPPDAIRGKKYILLGFAVYRNPSVLPFLEKISSEEKDPEIIEMCQKIMSVVRSGHKRKE